MLLLAHAADRYHVTYISGTWIALAQAANEGQFYPPLFDGDHYGGTRYMPVPVLLHAGAARLTGEYLLSGKLLDFATTALLLGLLYGIIVRRGGQHRLGVVLVAGVVAGEVGLIAAFGIRHEAIPTGLQLAAIALVASRRGSATIVALAAILCVLAFFSKLSAVYSVLVILILLWRDRTSLATFVVIGLVGLVSGLAIMELLSDGRFAETILQSAIGNYSVERVLAAPARLVWLLRYTPATLLLLSYVVIVLVRSRRRQPAPYALALVLAGLITTAVLLDRGASGNHLLDLVVLTPIVALDSATAALAGAPGHRPLFGKEAVSRTLPLVASLGAVLALGAFVADELPGAVGQLRTGVVEQRYDARPLPPAGGADTLLSEDPYLPVSLGQRPVILDPFLLSRLGERHPEWIQSLAQRVERAEFARVVLLMDINDSDAEAWYTGNHLGLPILSAMRESYDLGERIPATGTWLGMYFVYVPKSP